jgi:hypothetical protein
MAQRFEIWKRLDWIIILLYVFLVIAGGLIYTQPYKARSIEVFLIWNNDLQTNAMDYFALCWPFNLVTESNFLSLFFSIIDFSSVFVIVFYFLEISKWSEAWLNNGVLPFNLRICKIWDFRCSCKGNES